MYAESSRTYIRTTLSTSSDGGGGEQRKHFQKVIKLKNEGLKLTCGAGCPVDRGVVESRLDRVDR